MNNTESFNGLTTKEAQQRLLDEGPNLVEEKRSNNLVAFLQKFWAPIPWMLEVTIILELILHKYDEAIIIFILLLFNSSISFLQENHANKALTLLRKHLAIQTRVFRDGSWQLILAENIVRGDIVHLRMGDIAPADIRLLNGKVLIDQSSLTGEAMPVEGESGKVVYSASIIKQGEATGEVTAIGKDTYFGKTVSLMQTATTTTHIREVIFNIVKYLITFIALLALLIFIYAMQANLPIADIIPFILILLIAAIPVALPATFTLATALGALKLVKKGVLVTHLSAIEEASVIDIICVDKTGTITQNKLELTALYAIPPYTETTLLLYAALASDEATQDPIDQAILKAAATQHLMDVKPDIIQFVPFDPATKYSEAISIQDKKTICIIKGAFDIIKNKLPSPPDLSDHINAMGNKGYRILAVAAKDDTRNDSLYSLVGLIGLYDPPRGDSKYVIEKLKDLGIRLLMLTGDNSSTAKSIAESMGMGNRVCTTDLLKQSSATMLECDVFANLFPDEKFLIVKNLQRSGHEVGMTGDGVNDAPSLKQAEVGIALSNATDVAKAAASIVLTQPGLSGILSAIETSRRVYQRMHTYILNKISKSVEISVFLTLGLLLTGELILTPMLMVLLMFTNDFVTMAIATDNATFSPKPERWKIANVMLAGGIIGVFTLILSLGVFYYVKTFLNLTLPELQTTIFILLVFTAQSNVYIARERYYFWHSRPSRWLILSSCIDILVVIFLAAFGILMTPINLTLIVGLFLVVLTYFFIVDFLKVHLFAYLKLN